jgi:5-methylcytosine-specific restriction endonuclease McrA
MLPCLLRGVNSKHAKILGSRLPWHQESYSRHLEFQRWLQGIVFILSGEVWAKITHACILGNEAMPCFKHQYTGLTKKKFACHWLLLWMLCLFLTYKIRCVLFCYFKYSWFFCGHPFSVYFVNSSIWLVYIHPLTHATVMFQKVWHKSELNIHMVNYIYVSETESSWNSSSQKLKLHSMTTYCLGYCLEVLFCHLCLSWLSLPQGEEVITRLKKDYFCSSCFLMIV